MCPRVWDPLKILYYLYSSDKNIDNKKAQAYPEFNLYNRIQAKKMEIEKQKKNKYCILFNKYV